MSAESVQIRDGVENITDENLRELTMSFIEGVSGYGVLKFGGDLVVGAVMKYMKSFITSGNCTLAIDGNKVIGIFGFSKIRDDFNGKPLIDFPIVTVLPEYRGKHVMFGLGASALQDIMSRYGNSVLLCNTRNRIVEGVCKDLGFVSVSMRDYMEKIAEADESAVRRAVKRNDGTKFLISSKLDAVSMGLTLESDDEGDVMKEEVCTRRSVSSVFLKLWRKI